MSRYKINEKKLWYPVLIELDSRKNAGATFGFPLTAPSSPRKEWGEGVNAHLARKIGNWESDHGVDLFRPKRSKVYAIADGTVCASCGFGYTAPTAAKPTIYGRRFTLQTDFGDFYYTHLLEKPAPKLKRGAKLKRGDLVGWLDTYGMPHLHIAFNGEKAFGDKYAIERILKLAYRNTGLVLLGQRRTTLTVSPGPDPKAGWPNA